MTDRELLELAAKVCGTKVAKFSEQEGYKWEVKTPFTCPVNSDKLVSRSWVKWNPLVDDGDALRLVVTLGIHITNSQSDAWATTHAVTAIESLTNNPYTATRRAIVRAAAEIGRLTKD